MSEPKLSINAYLLKNSNAVVTDIKSIKNVSDEEFADVTVLIPVKDIQNYVGGEYVGSDDDGIVKVYAWEDEENES